MAGEAILPAWMREAFGAIKLGPGVVGTTATVAIVGLIVCAAIAYVLSSQPLFVLAIIALIFLFMAAYIFFAFRFAEKHPAAAMLGGTHLYNLLDKETGAKNPDLVIEHQPLSSGIPASHSGTGQ